MLFFRQLCRAAVGGLLGLPKVGLDRVEGDPGQLGLYIGRYLGPEGGQVLHVGGGDRAVAIGGVERSPRERAGPGPDAARMASATIEDVAVESRMEGTRGDPELVGGGASEVVAKVFPFAGVDLVVAIMVFWRGLAGARGWKIVGRGGTRCGFFCFVPACTLSATDIRA